MLEDKTGYWERVRYYASYESGNDGTPYWLSVLATLWGDLKHHALALVCRFRGHVWIEEGDAGPESGWIGATCSRCGKSFTKTLY